MFQLYLLKSIIIKNQQMHNNSYLKPPSSVLNKSFDQTFLSNPSKQSPPLRTHPTQPGSINLQSQHILQLKQYFLNLTSNAQYSEAMLKKYSQLGQIFGESPKDMIKYHADWTTMPLCPPYVEKDILQSGVFYCYGKDMKFCPTIYFHPSKLQFKKYKPEDYLATLKKLMTPIEQNMLVLNKIERWNVVVDLRDFNEQPYKDNFYSILQCLKRIYFAYPLRLKRLFIIEKRYSTLWASKSDLLENIIEKLQLTKQCVRITSLKDLNPYIPPSQRQIAYGGVLEDLTQFWPIKTTYRHTEMHSKFIQESEDSCQYYSIHNQLNAQYFREGEKKRSLCNLRDHCQLF